MHIKYKIHCSDQDEGKKIILQHFSSHAMKPKGLLNPPFRFMYCLYFLFWDTFMHRHLQGHPPFSLSWRQIPLTSSFLFLSLLCPLSSSVIWRSLLFISFSSSALLWVEKGTEMWISVVLGTWNAFCVVWERLLRSRSQDRDPSRRLRSLSRDVARDRLSSLCGERLRLRPIWNLPSVQVAPETYCCSFEGNIYLFFGSF